MPNTQVAGVVYPVVNGGLAGSNRASALAIQNNASARQTALNKIGGATVVPQFSSSYPQQNGSQNTNNTIKGLTANGAQQNANSVYDAGALKKGGKRKTNTNTNTKTKTKTNNRKKKRQSKRRRIYYKK
jgi:ABC-type Na+ efflux pump permease subunit